MIQSLPVLAKNKLEDNSRSLRRLRDIFDQLNRDQIRYCHWKSNIRLKEALNGETDLDLLVDWEQSADFERILLQHGVKRILAEPGRRYPSLEDYLGYDPESGKLFHLHIHYQLVLGEQFVKNYRIPVESRYLDAVITRFGVRVPSPEYELIILSVRALLKYRDRDVIKDTFSIRYPGIPAHILDEIKHLHNQTTEDDIEQALSSVFDMLPGDVIQEFLQVVLESPRSGIKFYALRRRLRKALGEYQRYSRGKARLIYFRESWQRRNSFFVRKTKGKMTFAKGGLSMALIGVDGAGKTTLHQQIIAWLNWKMDIQGYYLGSKEPSKQSEILYLVFRMFRRSQRSLTTRFGDDNILARWLEHGKWYFLHAHHAAIGKDRYKRYQYGTTRVLNGSTVVYDRFPLELISSGSDYRLLDGPQGPDLGSSLPGFLSKRLISRELEYYRMMHLPDYLIVLDVDPEISIQRKPDHSKETVTAKSRAINHLLASNGFSNHRARIVHIDANLPLEQVLDNLKTSIWGIL